MPTDPTATPDLLAQLGGAARSALDTVAPSVVRIGRAGGRGCGVVVADGLVATNAHNLRDRTTTVTFADGRAVQAEITGVDVDGDLAVLRVDTAGAPAVEFGDGPETGDVVFAVTQAAAGGPRVSFGLVSGTQRAFRGPRGRRITGSIEHSAPLPRGSSGSPLVDAGGRVIGLSTHRIGDGFYLALPTDARLREQVDGLAAGHTRRRLVLGVGLAPAAVARRLQRSLGLPVRDGVLVRAVEEGSPAAHAGLTEGDLIVGAADQAIADVDDLFDALDRAGSAGPGAVTLELRVVRGADERTVTVTFEAEDPDGAGDGDGSAAG
jgi:serine protease Do